MKTNLIIEGTEQRVSKLGKSYRSFKTNQGLMSCFKDDVVAKLEKNIGKRIGVEVETRGEFKNITAFLGEPVEDYGVVVEEVKRVSDIAEARASKDQSMYTAYATQVFNNEVNARTATGDELSKMTRIQLMDLCIDLVKKAKEAFK